MTCLAETFQNEWVQLVIGPAAAVVVLAIANYWQAKRGVEVVNKYDALIAKKDETIQKITTESVACITNISSITAANSIALKEIAQGIAQVVENTKPRHP